MSTQSNIVPVTAQVIDPASTQHIDQQALTDQNVVAADVILNNQPRHTLLNLSTAGSGYTFQSKRSATISSSGNNVQQYEQFMVPMSTHSSDEAALTSNSDRNTEGVSHKQPGLFNGPITRPGYPSLTKASASLSSPLNIVQESE